MRALTTFLAAVALLAVTATTALAAPAGQNISFRMGAQYSSLLGGFDSGTVTFSGTIAAGELSRLRGTLDLGLSSYNISIDPSGAAVVGDQTFPVYWQMVVCDPFLGCTWTSGRSTFTHNAGTVPVDVRFGALHGSGTLSWASDATCVATCPPPGSWYFVPYPYSSLVAPVTSANEAGTLNAYGPAPIIK